jgi:hypothetical protein
MFPTLNDDVRVSGIGRGYVACMGSNRITIEFYDANKAAITVPKAHVPSQLYSIP